MAVLHSGADFPEAWVHYYFRFRGQGPGPMTEEKGRLCLNVDKEDAGNAPHFPMDPPLDFTAGIGKDILLAPMIFAGSTRP